MIIVQIIYHPFNVIQPLFYFLQKHVLQNQLEHFNQNISTFIYINIPKQEAFLKQ
ncbi:unnamed protein product [Paramecium sonneborni]|uniref:Uncharacterized protein n=1 Tax=Paramecium sonneborni TaxID=65129 RepID=A0A8S1RU19_9CILI|nr:unnamed protein product [Paramecium sonneborni]